jgi:hypothetical protein
MTRILLAAALLLTLPSGAAAQRPLAARSAVGGAQPPVRVVPADDARAAAQRAEGRISAVVSTGKWVTLGVAAVSAVYGFSESRRADELYDELERDCQAAPDLCRQRTGDGAYLDADLEARYQDVLGIDRRTRQALFVTQASLLASAVLFVLDLRHDDDRPDVPYDPPRLRLSPDAHRALRLEARLRGWKIGELVNW